MRRSIVIRRERVGIAIADGALYAVQHTGARTSAEGVWSRALSLEEPDELRGALVELREAMQLRAPIAHVALLPPLVHVRCLRLPRLRERELLRVLARDVARFVLDAPEAAVAGASVGAGPRRGAVPVLAAFAAGRLVEAVHDAARPSGWRVATIVPAESAWAAAARDGVVVVPLEREIEVLGVRRGRVTAVRRLPRAGARAADALCDAVRPLCTALHSAAGVHIVGTSDDRCVVSAILGGNDTEAPADPVELTGSPGAVAARFAHRAIAPELAPLAMHEARARRSRGMTIALSSAAAMLLAAAAAADLWGVRRELALTQMRRAALARRVAIAMAQREAAAALDARLDALATLEASAPRWSAALALSAAHLPRDAHLTALRGVADTLVLEGEAPSAVAVLKAFRRAPAVSDVRAEAPIRQEVSDGGAAIQRFALRAALRHDTVVAEAP
jgi:hypothetical protein